MATPGVDGENDTKTQQMPVVVTSPGAAICSRPQVPKAESVCKLHHKWRQVDARTDGWMDRCVRFEAKESQQPWEYTKGSFLSAPVSVTAEGVGVGVRRHFIPALERLSFQSLFR